MVIFINIKEKDILAAHRVPTRIKNNPPNIVAQLKNRSIKAEYVKLYKSYIKENGALNGFHIHAVLGENKIFVSEHLIPELKILRKVTKTWASEHNFEHVWTDDGQIKLRRTFGWKVHTIRSEKDLESVPLTQPRRSQPAIDQIELPEVDNKLVGDGQS